MLGNLVRIVFALTAIAPLSISVAYVFAVKDQNLRWAFIAFCCCLLMGALALWIVENARARLERLPITIKKAKSADKEVIGFFVAYALPLLFKGEVSADLGAWGLAAALLLFVLWSTHAIQVNPVLGLFGLPTPRIRVRPTVDRSSTGGAGTTASPSIREGTAVPKPATFSMVSATKGPRTGGQGHGYVIAGGIGREGS